MLISRIRKIIISLQRDLLRKDHALQKNCIDKRNSQRDLLLNIIKILDDLQFLIHKSDKYLNLEERGCKKYVGAIRRVEKGLLENLVSAGVTSIELQENDLASPETCQIVDTEKTSQLDQAGKIAKIIKSGYCYQGEVLRFCSVITYTRSDELVERTYS